MTQLQLQAEAAAAPRCVTLPRGGGRYLLSNAHIPTGCVQGPLPGAVSMCVDNLALCDMLVEGGKVAALYPAGQGAAHAGRRCHVVDLKGKMVLPTFADLHTHIGGWGWKEAGLGQVAGACGDGLGMHRQPPTGMHGAGTLVVLNNST